MHVIARPAITAAAQQRYTKARAWLDNWWQLASQATWTRQAEVRATYHEADEVGQCLVFNVCDNGYRLICRMTYANRWTSGTLLVKHFLTHAEYDKREWCKDCIPPGKEKRAKP